MKLTEKQKRFCEEYLVDLNATQAYFRAGYSAKNENIAGVEGLKLLKFPCKVKLYSDSAYVVNGFNQNWIDGWIKKGWKTSDKSPVKNVELWKRMLKAMEIHEVKFTWVKGHAGHEYNELCDSLAVAACKKQNLKKIESECLI